MYTSNRPASDEKCTDAGSGVGSTTGFDGDAFCGVGVGAATCARSRSEAKNKLNGARPGADPGTPLQSLRDFVQRNDLPAGEAVLVLLIDSLHLNREDLGDDARDVVFLTLDDVVDVDDVHRVALRGHRRLEEAHALELL